MHRPFKEEMTRRRLLELAKDLKRVGLSQFFNTRKTGATRTHFGEIDL
jgi:hypothetical protein